MSRPSLSQECWRTVGTREVERIALAAPPTAVDRDVFAQAAGRRLAEVGGVHIGARPSA